MPDQSALVTLVTPIFNRASTIEATALSVLEQTNPRWKWIVVDDGSSDETWMKLQALQKEDSRIVALRRNRSPKGACTCRNVGVENASTSWVFFLDSDDVLEPGAVDLFERHIEKNEARTFFFNAKPFEPHGKLPYRWSPSLTKSSWVPLLLALTPACSTSGPLWRKSELLEVGGWNENLHVWQDVELHLRAYIKGITFTPAKNDKPVISIRQSEDSLSKVDYHNPEKTWSRWRVALYVMHEGKREIGDFENRNALGNLVIGVFNSALQSNSHQLASEMLSTINFEEVGLSKTKFQFARFCRRFGLHKIPKIGLGKVSLTRR